MKEIQKKLLAIQSKLDAPKGQHNTFGNYNYRSCEDILAALKPLLEENECTLTISDEIAVLGTRYYIRATATLTSEDECVSVCGYAREAETKKGMDVSQITGAASSYARKYALNGLFCIDDTKDADTKDNSEVKKARAEGKTPGVPVDKTGAKFNCTAKDCGKEISEKVANYSSEHYEATLCMDCQKKAKKHEEDQEPSDSPYPT